MTDPVRAGLLCNPLSGRLRGTGPGSGFELNGATRCLEATGPEAIASAVDAFLADGVEVLAVAGGDGTVHAALDRLLSVGNGPRPLLAVIPAGTTNMTALDLGIRGRPHRVMQRFNRWLAGESGTVVIERPVLRIEQGQRQPRHGMFFGAGSIAGGVRQFRDRVRDLGITGEKAGGLVFLGILIRLMFRRHDRVLEPVHMTIRNAAGDCHAGLYSTILASSLDRLLLGMRPYWGMESAPIHVTMVGDSPDRFWRSLLLLLAGQGRRLRGRTGFDSYNTGRLELTMNGDFIIDGELYRADSGDGPLSITASGPVRFLVP